MKVWGGGLMKDGTDQLLPASSARMMVMAVMKMMVENIT